MRGPVLWFGGKGHLADKIVALFPPHHTYVEPFGGGASVLFAKAPSPVEVYNDLDEGLVNFFRVLRNREQFEEFHRLVSLTPYSRAEYYSCRSTWEECEGPVERAYRWYVVARQAFSGCLGGGWGPAITHSRRGMAGTTAGWLSVIERLPEIAERLLRVQVECQDWRVILERYDRPETLFYLDPPYIHETRKAGEYKHELSDDDHRDLVDILLNIRGMAVLSGYQHPIYGPLENAGWQRHDYEVPCFAAGRTRATGILGNGASLRMQPRIESVWIKPWNRLKGLPLFDDSHQDLGRDDET